MEVKFQKNTSTVRNSLQPRLCYTILMAIHITCSIRNFCHNELVTKVIKKYFYTVLKWKFKHLENGLSEIETDDRFSEVFYRYEHGYF